MLATYKKADVSFRTIKDIGAEGKNSKVHLAHDEYLDCEIALKEILKSSIKSTDDYFLEAKLLYASSHPNIVKINYAAVDTDNIYVSMPYYKNGSLSSKMESVNLTSREIIRYSIHFLSGLHHIHSKGLIHFDIKPNNIMLSDRDEALLSDFGLAEQLDAEGLAQPKLIYNLHTPPERYLTKKFNLTYDIYQAGLTMYRMALGTLLFQQEVETAGEKGDFAQQIVDGKFPSKNFPPHINKKLQKIIIKCLEPDTDKRYQSVLSILNDLSIIDDGSLDWRLEFTAHSIAWKKALDDATLTLTLSNDDRDCECIRVYLDGRNSRRFGAMCEKNLTPTKLSNLFKNNG